LFEVVGDRHAVIVPGGCDSPTDDSGVSTPDVWCSHGSAQAFGSVTSSVQAPPTTNRKQVNDMSSIYSIDLAQAVMSARTAEIAKSAAGRCRVVVRRRQRRAQRAAYRIEMRLLQAG
jgi:hypothetical protein